MSRNVIHLENKKKKQHEYFGSIAALIAATSKNKMGISQSNLYRWDFKKPFENENFVIRQGRLKSKNELMTAQTKKNNGSYTN